MKWRILGNVRNAAACVLTIIVFTGGARAIAPVVEPIRDTLARFQASDMATCKKLITDIRGQIKRGASTEIDNRLKEVDAILINIHGAVIDAVSCGDMNVRNKRFVQAIARLADEVDACRRDTDLLLVSACLTGAYKIKNKNAELYLAYHEEEGYFASRFREEVEIALEEFDATQSTNADR